MKRRSKIEIYSLAWPCTKWKWRCVAPNGRITFQNSEVYSSVSDALRSIRAIFKAFIPANMIEAQVLGRDGNVERIELVGSDASTEL